MCVRIYIIHACTCDLCCLYDPINSTARWISLMLVFRFCFFYCYYFFGIYFCALSLVEMFWSSHYGEIPVCISYILYALCDAVQYLYIDFCWCETKPSRSARFYFFSVRCRPLCLASNMYPLHSRFNDIFIRRNMFFFLCVCAVVVGHFCFRRYECCWLAPQQTKRTVNG